MAKTPTLPKDGYEVEQRLGCTIVRGAIPVDRFAEISRQAPPGAVVDMQLTGYLNATLVSGTPEDLRRLRESLPAPGPGRLTEAYTVHNRGLSRAAVEWVFSGQRGLSSETLFRAATGIGNGDGRDIPHDTHDFARCRHLVETVPEVGEHLDRARNISPVWKALVDAWAELCETMDRETPRWRTTAESCPPVDKCLRAIADATQNTTRDPENVP